MELSEEERLNVLLYRAQLKKIQRDLFKARNTLDKVLHAAEFALNEYNWLLNRVLKAKK